MAWIRVESSVARHRKFLTAGPAASWLWLCGLAYSQEGLTNGFIPFQALRLLGVQHAETQKRRLVAVGLWDEVEGGWQIHDYLRHNRSADDVRRIQHERREAGQLGGAASGIAKRKQPAEANASTKSEATVEPIISTATATATEKAGTYARAPLHDRSHRNHAHCGRVCLHATLFGEFVRRRNHADADREIRDFCMDVERQWGDGSPNANVEPGDPFEFWKARYAERWPAAASTPVRKVDAWQPRTAV